MPKAKNKITELNAVLALVPDDKKTIAHDLIQEILFMSETLESLKLAIRGTGVTDEFKQGKQQFIRENPALKSYNTTIQRYGAIYKQLIDLMPKSTGKPPEDDDGFDGFVGDRGD